MRVWWIAALLFASTTINYIDRQTLSVLAPYLKRDFACSNSDFALIVIAFRAAYISIAFGSASRSAWHAAGAVAVAWYSALAMATSAAAGLKSFAFSDSSSGPAKLPIGRVRPRPYPNSFRNRSAGLRSPYSIAAQRSAAASRQ